MTTNQFEMELIQIKRRLVGENGQLLVNKCRHVQMVIKALIQVEWK